MPKQKIDKKSERIVKDKSRTADIIKANPKTNTIKIRTKDNKGNKSARSYKVKVDPGMYLKKKKK